MNAENTGSGEQEVCQLRWDWGVELNELLAAKHVANRDIAQAPTLTMAKHEKGVSVVKLSETKRVSDLEIRQP